MWSSGTHGFQVARHLLCSSVLCCAVHSHCFLWVAVCMMQLIIPCGYLGDLPLGASGHEAVSNVMSKQPQRPTVFKAAVTLYPPTNIGWALQFPAVFFFGGGVFLSRGRSVITLQCGLDFPKDILLIFPCGAYQSFVYLKKGVFNPFAHLKKKKWSILLLSFVAACENGLYRLICWRTWSAVSGTVWEWLGGVAFEEVCHGGGLWGIISSMLSAFCLHFSNAKPSILKKYSLFPFI